MGIVSDGFRVYATDASGKRRNATTTKAKIGDEYLYLFDPKTGRLEVSASPEDVVKLVRQHGPFPIAHLALPAFDGNAHFHNVKEIISLPRQPAPRPRGIRRFFSRQKPQPYFLKLS